MIDRLARLADGHARRALIVAAIFFVVAGALGAGVADRLDPYGADDPSTESVNADERSATPATARPAWSCCVTASTRPRAAGRERVAALARPARRATPTSPR